jgi:hypothetical protein
MATKLVAGANHLELPAAIEVHLVSDNSAAVSAILVALDLLHQGRYYYGTLIGLSDAAGRARLAREQLELDFAESQRIFVMDYKVPLKLCDREAVIRIEGGLDFTKRLRAADSELVDPSALALWKSAANEKIESTRVPFALDKTDPDGGVVVEVHVQARKGWFR